MTYRLIASLAAAAALPFGAAFAADDVAGEEIRADLVDTGGQTVGEVVVSEAGSGLLLRVDVRGLPPGPHGMHLHTVGDCDSLGGFETAGEHISQEGQAHGLLTENPHDGDLPNLIVGSDGTATAEVATFKLPLRGAHGPLLDQDGSALMIHAHTDDHVDADGGGSGARIACAELKESAAGVSTSAE